MIDIKKQIKTLKYIFGKLLTIIRSFFLKIYFFSSTYYILLFTNKIFRMDISSSKIFSCNNIKPPVEGRCGYFVKRKQRFCKMLPPKDQAYCAEHLFEEKTQVNIKVAQVFPLPFWYSGI